MTFEEAWQKGIIERSTPDQQKFLKDINKYKPIINALWELAYNEGKMDVIKMINMSNKLKEKGVIQ